MRTEPLSISVVMPAFNAEAFLSEAVESIQRQNYNALEIIMVDDGSTDGTRNVVEGLSAPITYIRQTNSGPSAARNRGLKEAKGNLIGFLDADDLWPEETLKPQVSYLMENPSVQVVQGKVWCMKMAPSPEGKSELAPLFDPCFAFNLGSMLFRRSAFEKVGFFDTKLPSGEDVDWFLRAREHGIVVATRDQVTLHYRIHSQNMTRNTSVRDHYFLQVLKKSLDRQRKQRAS